LSGGVKLIFECVAELLLFLVTPEEIFVAKGFPVFFNIFVGI